MHKPTLSIYTLDETNTKFFKLLLKNNTEEINEILTVLPNSENTINQLKQLLSIKTVTKNHVERLALLVSQECPLKCVYCYANGGTYGEGGLMNISTLENTLTVFYNLYGYIETIQLFGGEPLLNLKAIKKLIETLKILTNEKKISASPKISLETGLGVSQKNVEELVKLIKDNSSLFEFEIVVSLDGPEIIQNTLRPFKDGSPSYNRVIENLDILRNIYQPKAIEVTYTKKHLEFGFSREDLKNFFAQKLGITSLMIVPVISNHPDLLIGTDLFTNSVIDILKLIEKLKTSRKFENQDEISKRIKVYLSNIFNSNPTEYFCGAGITSFAVSAQGDIYPCQLVVGKNKFKIANVNDDLSEVSKKLEVMKEKYKVLNSKSNDTMCKECFLEYLCEGCVFEEHVLGKSSDATIPHEYCKIKMEIVKKIFDEKVWEWLY